MKKTILLLAGLALMFYVSAQDVIVGWTFPYSVKTPDQGLSINSSRYIGTESDAARPTYFTNGQTSGDTAATVIGWHNGTGTKYWIVKFKTTGYKDIKISSKQRAGNQNGGGPRDFVIQWKKGSASWTNIINDTIHVANDWTTGVVTDAAFPAGADTATSNISVRWVMATDTNITGMLTDSLAISKIDDIIVKGTAVGSGLEEVIYSSSVNIYPNPSTGIFRIESTEKIESFQVINNLGAVILNEKPLSNQLNFDLLQSGKGYYLVRLTFENGLQTLRKVIVY